MCVCSSEFKGKQQCDMCASSHARVKNKLRERDQDESHDLFLLPRCLEIVLQPGHKKKG